MRSLDLADEPGAAIRGLRLGIMGGSFDPPHLGHLAAAQAVREALALDRILFVPTATSPLKVGAGAGTPSEIRLRMTLAAVEEDPYVQVSAMEIERGGVSYTVDTLRALEPLGAADLYVMIGSDQWAAFPSWKEPEEVARLARVVVMTREGMAGPKRHPELPGIPEPLRVDVPRIDLSSSFVRREVQAGRSIRYLVPEPVRRIIESAGLYLEA
jgi:nicotinate-nucleotide adenylyltransferase